MEKALVARGLATILSVLLSCVGGYAQSRNPKPPLKQPRIVRSLPTVYIRIEPSNLTRPVASDNGVEFLLFRLYNNTRWRIYLDASETEKRLGDASLYYDLIENKSGSLGMRCHVCSIIPIAPGGSLRFGIPTKDVKESKGFNINFKYDWEESEPYAGREPTHRVYFYQSDIGDH